MKIFKGMLLSLLALIILTSGSMSFISNSYNTLSSAFTALQELIAAKSEISEVYYEEYYVMEPQFDTAYLSLNANQRKIYSKIYNISEDMPDGYIKLGETYADIERDIAVAYTAFLYDRVEVFWMPYTYIISNYSEKGVNYTAISFSTSENGKSTDYNIPKSQCSEMKLILEDEINKILKNVQDFKTDYEKEKYFHDYICENTVYATEGELLGTAYGALIGKRAQCEGYSRAFKLLCNRSDIGCDMICGTSFGEGHMWNIVNIDGTNNYVDVTWDDRNEEISYMYFNITESQLEFDHEIAPLHSKLSDSEIKNGSFNFVSRKATYSENTYYAKIGNVLELSFSEATAQKITEAHKTGEKSAEFMFVSKIAREQFEADNEKFIRSIQNYLFGAEITGYAYERDILTLFWD